MLNKNTLGVKKVRGQHCKQLCATKNFDIGCHIGRLPYALRTELEAELFKLMDSGCIESLTSPYASGLVLVHKKDGGLRVCADYWGSTEIQSLIATRFHASMI